MTRYAVTKEETYSVDIDYIYPVGSVIVLSTTDDPNDLYSGTTWETISKGMFLGTLGTATDDDGDSVTFSRGTISSRSYTNCTKAMEPKHQLTISEMPAHSHSIDDVLNDKSNSDKNTNGKDGTNGRVTYTQYYGGYAEHENRQPYKVAYIWRRTA